MRSRIHQYQQRDAEYDSRNAIVDSDDAREHNIWHETQQIQSGADDDCTGSATKENHQYQ